MRIKASAEKLGAVMPSALADEAVLSKLGVPTAAIVVFGEDLKNTDEEAIALRDWARDNNVHSAIVPVMKYSDAARSRIMRRIIDWYDMIIEVPALDPPDYNQNDWWRSNRALIDFQIELVKYIYYRIKY